MSLSIANVGGTLTGGSTVLLTFAGSPQPGKASYVAPDHTRLAQRTVDFLATQAVTTAKDPGVARGGLKITFGDRQTSGECCSVQQGSVIIDVGVRWSLNQPEALADDAVKLLQAVVFSPAFINAVKKGLIPSV